MTLLMFFLVCLCRTGGAQPVIEGDVVDGDTGKGIPGAGVRAGLDDGTPSFTTTDAAGHFRFVVLVGDKFWISARQIGYMGPRDGPQSWGGNAVLVYPGRTEPVRIELVRYGAVAGTVTDGSGAPVAMSRVTVMRKVPVETQPMSRPERLLADGEHRLDVAGNTYTDERAMYRFARLRAGTYYVTAEPAPAAVGQDRTARTTYYGGGLDFSGAKPIEVASGRTIEADIEIQGRTGVRVSGRIVGATARDGVYTAVSLVSASESGASWQYGRIDGERFEIDDVLPGKYMLTAVTRERYGRPEATKDLAASLETIEVDQADITGLSIAPQGPRDLEGIVRIDSGCHAGSVRLQIRPLAGLSEIDVSPDPDGSFVLKNVVPARYELRASIPGDTFARLGAIRLGGRESRSGFVMESQDYGPVQVGIVCPHGNLSYEVRDPGGALAENVVVRLVSTGNSGHQVSICQPKFSGPVAPGNYDVFVCPAPSGSSDPSRNCEKAAGPLTVQDGADSRLVLTLPAASQKEVVQ